MRKRRRIKKKIRNFFVIILFGIIGTYSGFFLQRFNNYENIPVEVAYTTVETKEVYTSSMVMVGDALIHAAIYNTYRSGNNYNFKKNIK